MGHRRVNHCCHHVEAVPGLMPWNPLTSIAHFHIDWFFWPSTERN